MDISASDFNKRIQFFAPPGELNGAGYRPGNPEPVYACWARFSRQSGTEQLKAGADLSDERVRFLIRSTSVKLTRKMIVRYAEGDYEIELVNDYNDCREYTEIWARRQTTGA